MKICLKKKNLKLIDLLSILQIQLLERRTEAQYSNGRIL